MLKVILLSIGIIFVSLPYVNAVTVDPNTANNGESRLSRFSSSCSHVNNLHSIIPDCFTRIYAEAMIPPERTFRTSDTNSIHVCQDLCAAEGVRCQSFSLGISPLGNGTCQLSAERISENAGRRPRGTIYDPDFNLYQRKENCGVDDPNDLTRPTGECGVEVAIRFESINLIFEITCRGNTANGTDVDFLEWWTSVDNDHIYKFGAKLEYVSRSIASTHAIANRWKQFWLNYNGWHNICAALQTNTDNGRSSQHNVHRWAVHTDDAKWARSNAIHVWLWQHKHRHLHKWSATTVSDDDIPFNTNVRCRCQAGLCLSISAALPRQIQLLPGHLSDVLVSNAIQRRTTASRPELVSSEQLRTKCAVDWSPAVNSQLLW